MDRGFEQTFLPGRHTINNKHMKRCSTSLAIKEMQIKTIIRYHFAPTSMAIMKNTDSDKYWQGCKKKWDSQAMLIGM